MYQRPYKDSDEQEEKLSPELLKGLKSEIEKEDRDQPQAIEEVKPRAKFEHLRILPVTQVNNQVDLSPPKKISQSEISYF